MNRTRHRGRVAVLLAALRAATLAHLHAADGVWSATPADGAWENTANWNEGTVPGTTGTTDNPDTATFSSASTTLHVLPDAGRNVKDIVFDTAAAGPYVIGETDGNALLLSDGGTVRATSSAGSAQRVDAPLRLQGERGNHRFASDSANSARVLNFGGAVSGASTEGNTTTLTLDGGNTGANMLAGAVADGTSGGTLAIAKKGVGTWQLAGANSYSGGTTLDAGTLHLYHATALGTGTVTINGGTFGGPTDASLIMTTDNPYVWNGSFTAYARYTKSFNIGSGNVLLTTNIIITGAANQWGAPFIVGGAISDDGNSYSLTVRGGDANPAALQFSGANTFSGGCILEGGSLLISRGEAIGTGPLVFKGGGFGTTSWNVPVTLVNNNPLVFDGPVYIRGGTGAINFGTGGVSLTGSRTLSLSNTTLTFPNAITNVGGRGYVLTANFGEYSATLNLGGANTFDGGLTINTAAKSSTETLQLTSLGTGPAASPLGTGPLTLNRSGGTLRINNASGADGTISTHNAQRWNADAFTFAGSSSLDTGTNTVTLGADVTVDVAAKTLTVGGPLVQADGTPRGLRKTGAGTLALAGAGAYAGGTAVAAGVLSAEPGGTLGTGPVSVDPPGRLVLKHGDAIADDAVVTLNRAEDACGKMEIAAGVVERVGSVILDGVVHDAPGTSFGATGSGANVQSDDFFLGTGILRITAPENTMLIVR